MPCNEENASTGLLAPLKNRTFRSIFLASQLSSLGWLMQTVALSWLMATVSTSDVMVALVQASSTLPAFFLAVFVGAIADNYGRRMVMIVGRSLMMAAAAMLTILIAFGITDPWMILAFSFLDGCGIALSDPAWRASLGDMLERRHLPAAVTLLNVGFNTVRSVGPALGGLIVAAFGPLVAFALTTLGFVAPLTALCRNKWKVQTSPLPREALMTAIYDGLRFTAISSEIKSTIVRGTLFGFAAISTLALLPLIARDILKGGPISYGIMMGGFGAGALLAGLMNPTLRRMFTQECVVVLACIACAICQISLALTSPLAIATFSLAAGGAGWVTAWSGLGVNVQLASPRWIVGRTISIYSAFTYGGIAAGSWFWGVIVQNYSLPIALGWSGTATLVVAALGFKLPISNRSESELEPSGFFSAPAVALDLKPRSGPILVMTEYTIPEENADLFLDVMQKRRYAQSRVGARQWTLTRDVQEPSRWLETFRTPTWTDFHRLHHRLTEADEELNQELIRLSDGTNPPRTTILVERPTGAARKSYPVPYVSQK
ncbi:MULTISPECIES: MFS transporter [Sinorhizobium]|uniref:MFS transporter n=1 Tax=Sinorhizobium americanum TaxID=194963 RepID=A0A2S3YNC4_9HYPH|nr:MULTISPECIES: MFS transporter [Sinorhizobium]PDT33068.1 MFS transporter [Sinorhizobium sp. FG01]PDT49481.1 MFS transporter [Sinorhizobium sp. NG07B]POH30554.1 MFS transporter [Sinorhizobium americanum]POH33314.1 MFS transporter [Sinorhizobium americanum]